jgi:hypothetical protein
VPFAQERLVAADHRSAGCWRKDVDRTNSRRDWSLNIPVEAPEL